MLSKAQFTKKLGENIKKIREQKGVSQEELAHLSGLYRTYAGHVEQARYNASAYTIYKIARALKCGVEELIPKQ